MMLYGIIILTCLSLLDTIIGMRLMILRKAYHCVPDSKITLNYTYSRTTNTGLGYCEFLERIDSNSNLQVSVNMYYKSQNTFLFTPKLNVSKTDLCVFLNTDLSIIPHIQNYVYIDRFCPITKNKVIFHKSTVVFNKPYSIYPIGTVNSEVRVENKNKIYACLRFCVQVKESMETQTPPCD